MIHECLETLDGPLVILERSLDEESVPREWKGADVAPIFKKGDREIGQNYRTVSRTSLFCRPIRKNIGKQVDNSLGSKKKTRARDAEESR